MATGFDPFFPASISSVCTKCPQDANPKNQDLTPRLLLSDLCASGNASHVAGQLFELDGERHTLALAIQGERESMDCWLIHISLEIE